MRQDYCGPYWAPKWFRRFLSKKFNASCKVHDLDYSSKGFSRGEADSRFLNHMNRQANSNLCWKLIAFIYYSLVRIGGKFSWDNADKD